MIYLMLSVWAAALALSLGVHRRLRRSERALAPSEQGWERRQLFLVLYPLPLLATTATTIAGLGAMKTALAQAAALVFNLVVAAVYMIPYLEALRRGAHRQEEAPASSLRMHRMLGSLAMTGLLNAVFGLAMVGLFWWMTKRVHVPTVLAAVAAGGGIVLAAQTVFAWRIRLQAAGVLAADHPLMAALAEMRGRVAALGEVKNVYLLPHDLFPVVNAYVIGPLPGSLFVAVTEDLLRALSPAETRAILLHDAAHARERHTLLLTACCAVWAAVALIFAMGACGGLPAPAAHAGPGLTIVRVILPGLGTVLWLLLPFAWLSRRCERCADGFVHRMGEGAALRSALIKLQRFTQAPSRWSWWFGTMATHPQYEWRLNQRYGTVE
jgi:Zn-dependent protease with chaperone function